MIHAEMHARPVMPITAPVRVRRAAFISSRDGRDIPKVQQRIIAWLTERHAAPADVSIRQYSVEAGGHGVTFELHSEFVTITWTSAPDDWEAWPDNIGLELFGDLELISATRLDLANADTIAPSALAGFNPLSLCYSDIFHGSAQVATDFVADENGFTRFEVAAARGTDLRRGTMVRRLLEIETYRNVALMGLPIARSLGPRLHSDEMQLAEVMRQIGEDRAGRDNQMRDNQAALNTLHDLSIAVGQTVDETSFRFAASRAYGGVLKSRIGRLDEVAIGEFTTIERYLDNRVGPALTTCTAVERRLEALANKLQRSTELLDARIGLSIETQNQAVLDNISRTSLSQYKLQETVEGLSIIAISYYTLAILGYLLEGLHSVVNVDKNLAEAIAAPFVVLLVWLAIRRIRRGK
jgi:uncharacterized membrane-anchored protein